MARGKKKRRAVIEAGEPRCPGEVFYRNIILSDLEVKNGAIEELIAALRAEGFLADEHDALRAQLCFDESLVNAIKHGNGCDSSKRITVTASATAAKWNVLIEDEGNGFSERDVPDPDDPMSLLMEGGRGILIMRSFLSRLTHYRGGSALLMEKYQKRKVRPSRRGRVEAQP